MFCKENLMLQSVILTTFPELVKCIVKNVSESQISTYCTITFFFSYSVILLSNDRTLLTISSDELG